jgi:hypothetical protein
MGLFNLSRRRIFALLGGQSALLTALPVLGLASAPDQKRDNPPAMYPKTDAESSAGAAIVNSNYPPLNVDRYGTNTTPGTTRMAAAFQAAINVAKTTGGVVTWGRTAPYLIDAPLDCTCRPHASIFGFTIRGEGQVSAISVNAPYYPGVIFKHDGVAGFDCTGNLGLLFDGGSYGTDRATFPKTGFLLARNSDKRSQVVRFRNVRTIGSFGVACLYNYGSEDDGYIDCWWQNCNPAAGTKTRVYTSTNIFALTSSFTTIAAGSLSTIDHNSFGCQDQNDAGTSTSDCIYLDAVDSFKSYGGWAYSGNGASNGRALVFVDGTNNPSNYCVIDGLSGESAAFLQAKGIEFANTTKTGSNTHVGWNVVNCKIPAARDFLAVSRPITLDTFALQGNSAPGAAINITGTLQNSANFNYNGIRTAIASSINNTLIGQTERLTVTARSNDYWIDTGTANKSFAPAIISGANKFNAVGAIAQRGKCLFSGSKVDFSIVLSAATSIAWTSGATITTLPGVATDTFTCDVTDSTAGTLIGRGVISAGSGHSTVTLTVAQPATPHGITISGSYFVA